MIPLVCTCGVIQGEECSVHKGFYKENKHSLATTHGTVFGKPKHEIKRRSYGV